MWLYFIRILKLFESQPIKLLHIAPEKAFAEAFEKCQTIDYVTADLTMSHTKVKMDLTKIPFRNNTFDAIYCSHVLEHIPDDKSAVQELIRILKPSGWAVLQVPIDTNREITLEDPQIKTPEERQKHYWQFDHVRLYGRDYQSRLEVAGFEVTVDHFVRTFSDAEVRQLGLDRNEDIYFCIKPSTSQSGRAG